MVFSSWYTDLVDVHRVTTWREGGITKQGLKAVYTGIPCRIYSSQVNNWAGRDGAAVARYDEKMACDANTDIKAGDTLYITRGGGLNSGRSPERYIASSPKAFYDPVGGALTGLQHLEVGLHADNITEGMV